MSSQLSTPDGRDAHPHPLNPGRNRFTFSTWLFLRALALIHLIAFVSFWVQLNGLVGPHGLLPAQAYLDAVHNHLGAAAYFRLPTLCWIFGAGKFLDLLCAGGVVVSIALFAGVAPPVCLALLWAAYLSLIAAGQEFFNFQWDVLLLETTLFAVFLAPWSLWPRWTAYEPPRLARLLIWWLLFRLMFLAGVVKLASGDPSWRDLTALSFHFETQPLPTPLAWYAHQLPLWWQRAECAGMFVIELAVPFFIFAPRALRHNAALLLAAFMVAIALTGNYTFFNLLAIALCLTCLDDAFWNSSLVALRVSAGTDVTSKVVGPAAHAAGYKAGEKAPRWSHFILPPFALFVLAYTGPQTLAVLLPGRIGMPPGMETIARWIAPFRSLNSYGLFAVMTNPRPELIFEGSDDARDWRAYEFPDKPGDLNRRPTWVAPHQPRLDWQLWFAALDAPENNRWVLGLCEHLLRGTPEVLALLAHDPFPNQPPRFIRVIRYEYHFTDATTRARTGQWWRRTPMDVYVAPVSLK